MNARGGMRLLTAAGLAVLFNLLLFASAALLSRERPLQQDATDPVGVNLITIKPAAPPPPEEKREIKKPEPKPKLDFMPDLPRPSIAAPTPLDVQVAIDPDLFSGGPARGEFIFNAGELDQPPRKVVQTQPVYPYKARQRNIEGYVKIKLLVKADGSVGGVEVLDANPKGLFEDATVKAVPNWRFQPGLVDGQAVPSWVVTTVRFTLNN